MNIIEVQKILTQKFDFEWSLPPDLEMGILTTNHAFILAKNLKQNPIQIAQNLAKEIQYFFDNSNFLKDKFIIKTVGAYINLDLTEAFLEEILLESSSEKLLPQINQTVLIDFVSPNVAKPLHVGHLLQASFGEALYRILSLKYQKVVTESYWGDWGVPLGIVIWGWKQIANQTKIVTVNNQEVAFRLAEIELEPVDTLVKVYVWANQQKDITPNWDNLVRQEFLKLEQGEEQNRKLWKLFSDYSKSGIKQILQSMNVKAHNYNFGEAYYEKEAINLLEFLNQNQIGQKEGKAIFVDLESLVDKWTAIPELLAKKIKNFGRCYLVSSLGYTTYALRDIAARIHWARDLEVDLMLNLVGNEQNHHFDQFFAITAYLASLPEFEKFYSKKVSEKLKWENLVVFGHGMVNLSDKKMSTRKGNFITAKQILDQIKTQAKQTLLQKNPNQNTELELQEKTDLVSIAALKWFYLNKDISQNYNLNIDQILKFEGNTGVYQLYTLARINSILQKII
jgi:arginyl-tRNA synthetase